MNPEPRTGPALTRITDALGDQRRFALLAETFQALGDLSRVRIVWILSQGEFSVGTVARLVQMSQPAVSHHLKQLRILGLARARKDGRTVRYTLDDEHIDRLLQEGIRHVEEFL